MPQTSIQARLIKSFSLAILIPSLTTAVVGVLMIRRQVLDQAQGRIASDLSAAQEIYQNVVDRLKGSLRIHATRRVIYGALDGGDRSGLAMELERVRRDEGLDVLTLLDRSGRAFHRTRNPALAGDDQAWDELVRRVLTRMTPVAATAVVPPEELEKESADLARQAFMEITPTPKAGPTGRTRQSSGMMLKGAAPVFTADGRMVGVLVGAVLLNRSTALVDKIRTVGFREGVYRGQQVGTATIFQDDVRVSTNVKNADGSRAITTRASAEVADAVLRRGETWWGRAFVVNDWYLAAYAPIHDLGGRRIGMLYVGTLERPFLDSLVRHLYVFLGIALLGVVLVSCVAVVIAQRISRPVRAISEAAHDVAGGDYTRKVEAGSQDEIGQLAASFNRMTEELARANQELREWGENLERKVEQRTAELREMQAHMLRTEKLAAIGKLAAGVAHEINNPLTGVLTNSSLMLADLPPGDTRREDLQTIVDETLRCRTIVKGLLEFARQTKPQKQVLSLNAIVEDVLGLVRNQASFRNLEVTTALDANLPFAMADRDQMRQVILNLVLNAAEAMPEGGAITVRSRAGAGGGTVEVAIADTGPGIPDGTKEKLFEPFFTTKKTGTGLGLAIVYGIMEQHKGAVHVESALGQGTTMTISLPTTNEDVA
ncbi:MAG TPA: cache domain-containing protein [Polyangia bacterium]|jgi:two-component system NtrC family sensor kinase